jgi:hypothetical protein
MISDIDKDGSGNDGISRCPTDLASLPFLPLVTLTWVPGTLNTVATNTGTTVPVQSQRI